MEKNQRMQMTAVNIHKTFSWTSSVWGSWKNEKDWLLIPEILRFSYRIATQIWSNWNFLVHYSELSEVSDFFSEICVKSLIMIVHQMGLRQFFSATSRFSALAVLFIFFKVEMDINKHDLYSSKGHLALKCYKCNNSEETSSEV